MISSLMNIIRNFFKTIFWAVYFRFERIPQTDCFSGRTDFYLQAYFAKNFYIKLQKQENIKKSQMVCWIRGSENL